MSYDTLLQQGLKLHQQGQLDEAGQIYRQILQTAPNQPNILNLLGLIAQEKGLHNQAAEYFEQAIARDFNNFELYFNLGWSLAAAGKYHQAADAYQKALKIKPDIKEAYNALGEIYALTGDNAKAEKMFRTALDFAPGYAEAEINLAYLKQDTATLLALKEKHPNNPALFYDLALLYRNQGEQEKALKYAQDANNAAAHESYKLLIAELYLQKGEKEKAARYYGEALSLNPSSVCALINLANSADNADEAEKLYRRAIELAPDNFDAHLNFAALLQNQNRFSEALEEYRQAAIINPKAPEVSNNLGMLQRELGDLPQALDLFLNAFSLVPDNAEYALNVAETLIMLHRSQPEGAEKIAAQWLQSFPQNDFARHINAAFKGENIGNNFEYSRRLFDLFAGNYEQTMAALNYNLPSEMADMLGSVDGTIIDLGCGTGLLGEKLKNAQNSLTGVDISAQMLQKAAEKNIYAKLEQADIIEYSRSMPHADLVTAADVIGYIGDIAPLAKNIFPRPFAFSAATDGTIQDNYRLTDGGRYIYKPEYIEQTLQQAGYKNITKRQTILRTENGYDISGIIFYAKES